MVIFEFFEIFENGFGMRLGGFWGGGLFTEIYSFESYLYDFWILEAGKLEMF